MSPFLHAAAFVLGLFVVGLALGSAIRIVVLARQASDWIGRAVFRTSYRLFPVLSARRTTFYGQDRIMALFAPISLLLLPALVWFRSPESDRSWVTASGAILDSAAPAVSALDRPPAPQAQVAIRAGYVALRRISDGFGIGYDPDPAPTDPISIARVEFDEACDEMAEAGLSLKADCDQAGRDLAGWWVNYDRPLPALCALVMAPYAPWSSDRSILDWRRPPVLVRWGRRMRARAARA